MDADLAQEINETIRTSGFTNLPLAGATYSQTVDNRSRLFLSFGARISPGLAQNNLMQKVAPAYPPLAKQAGIEGEVVLEATIAKEGNVENLRVVSGHPLLIQAAMEAVKQWSYRPVLLNGAPVEVVTTVNVNFSLQ